MRQAKLGGKKNLRIFLKANDDVTGSLLAREGGSSFRDLVAEKYGGQFDVEMSHEPCHRSDIFLQQLHGRPAPAELARVLPELQEQFHTRLKEQPFDIVVLALEPDIVNAAWRHRQEGYPVCPPNPWREIWKPHCVEWFASHFEPMPLIPTAQSAANWTQIVQHIKQRLDAHVLIYNCSTVDPHDHIDNYHGKEDNKELRTHKLDLALMHLSVQEGISIIDVDRLIAEMGAQEHVRSWCDYSDEAHEAIKYEFLRVVEDIGFFENRPLLMQLGRKGVARCS
jgi:hypothetical protein